MKRVNQSKNDNSKVSDSDEIDMNIVTESFFYCIFKEETFLCVLKKKKYSIYQENLHFLTK